MLTVTNIFLLNLSIADLCVAFFCVYQNLSLYLLSNWIFGDFLCRMYHFIHAMSYTASVCIHVVIAIERYLALVKPFWARVLLTSHRLRMVIIAVWFLSAFACSPRLFIYKTIVSNFGTSKSILVTNTARILTCFYFVQIMRTKAKRIKRKFFASSPTSCTIPKSTMSATLPFSLHCLSY